MPSVLMQLSHMNYSTAVDTFLIPEVMLRETGRSSSLSSLLKKDVAASRKSAGRCHGSQRSMPISRVLTNSAAKLFNPLQVSN